MSTVDYMKKSLAFAHRALTDARNGTPEQLHFVPPAGSHSIAWCLWHTARIEDLIINAHIQKQPQVWDDAWAERIGVPAKGFGTGQSDAEAQAVHIKDISALAAYQDAVWQKTAEYLDNATDATLETELKTQTGTETAGDAIALHMLGHFNGHRGEINTLRGMQGMPPVLVVEGTH